MSEFVFVGGCVYVSIRESYDQGVSRELNDKVRKAHAEDPRDAVFGGGK